jgi:hypothetical protein
MELKTYFDLATLCAALANVFISIVKRNWYSFAGWGAVAFMAVRNLLPIIGK